ncbi:MAG TPA: DUF4403 family protein [Thermoanaerobaculia bacterium]|jgi:hypothetical protein
MFRRLLPLFLLAASRVFAQPQPELSTIVVPIRASLAPVLPQIEASVPKTFGDKVTERGFDIRFDVVRDPIALKMIGAGLHATTNAHYALEACRGRACVSCGFDETRPVASVALHSHLTWDAQWRLKSETRAQPIHFVRPCEITAFRIDADRYIAPIVNAQLREAVKVIDRNVPALTNIRGEAQKIWTSLQAPTEIRPRTWLVLEPATVALGPITGSGSFVTSTLQLRARTRVVVGNKPQIAVKPLPALAPFDAAANAMRVPLDVELTYADAAALFTKQFGNRTYKLGDRDLKVGAIEVGSAGTGSGKLVVVAAIDYRGYRGPVYLEGTPRFDAATSSVVVPDLDYSLDPRRRGFLTRIAEVFARDTIRARLREQARFSLAPQLAQIRAEVTKALTRQLSPGVQLGGRVDTIVPQGVLPNDAAIVVRVIATGAAAVDVTAWK